MMICKRLFIVALPAFMVGCADLYGTQPPAPVTGGKTVVSANLPKKSPRTQPKPAEEVAPIVQTTPLKDYEVKSEPLEVYNYQAPIEPKATPVAPEERPTEAPTPPGSPTESNSDQPVGQNGTGSEPTANQPTPTPPPIPVPEVQPPVVEKPKPMQFEPFESQTALSPAVGALVASASQNSKSGELDAAVTTIERAIRIEPRNANLYYKLAVIRLKQSKPRLAEDLAKKSALLASNDKQLKKHSWLLIAKARELQQDYDGSKEALEKANNF